MVFFEIIGLSTIFGLSALGLQQEQQFLLVCLMGFFALLPGDAGTKPSGRNTVGFMVILFSLIVTELAGFKGNALYTIFSLISGCLLYLTRLNQGSFWPQLVKQSLVIAFLFISLARVYQFELSSEGSIFDLAYILPIIYIGFAVARSKSAIKSNRHYHNTILFLAAASIPYLDYIGAGLPTKDDLALMLFLSLICTLAYYLVGVLKEPKQSWEPLISISFCLVLLSLYITHLHAKPELYYLCLLLYFFALKDLEKSNWSLVLYRLGAYLTIALIVLFGGMKTIGTTEAAQLILFIVCISLSSEMMASSEGTNLTYKSIGSVIRLGVSLSVVGFLMERMVSL